MSNKIAQIKTVAGNIITSISGSGPIYTPYVPLQTTTITIGPNSSLPSLDLQCNNNKGITYQFAIGKSYEFVFNYMKSIKPDETDFNDINLFCPDFSDEDFRKAIRRHVHKFKTYDRMFISQINEVCNRFYYVSEHSKNKADDYNITLIFKEKEVVFSASEFIDIIDQGIIRELPLVSIGKLYDDR